MCTLVCVCVFESTGKMSDDSREDLRSLQGVPEKGLSTRRTHARLWDACHYRKINWPIKLPALPFAGQQFRMPVTLSLASHSIEKDKHTDETYREFPLLFHYLHTPF